MPSMSISPYILVPIIYRDILLDRFREHAKKLGVSSEALYEALLADAEIEPDDWRYMGRQVNAWKQYGEHTFNLIRLQLD